VRNHPLQNLIESIYLNYPNVCDVWEIVAIVEALGYTDRMIQAEFSCPNALVLSQFIYAQRSQFPIPQIPDNRLVEPTLNFREELEIFITQFSHSFIYTIPFIIQLILDYLPTDPGKDFLPPELNSLFTIVTMASLITSSGFVQAIGRRGSFYMGLKDPIQANRICLPILWIGILTTIVLSLIGIVFGFYQEIAADTYVTIAGGYYVVMSTIWMLFAIVGLQYRFAAPMILVGVACCFFELRVIARLSAIEAQFITIAIAFALLIFLTVVNAIKYRPIRPKFGKIVALPGLSVSIYLLAPYFLYGIVYFGFIFADRLAATLTTGGIYTLVAGNNLGYQDSMDVALLDLLSIVPLVEYFSYKLIIYWYDRAKQMSLTEVDRLAWQLQKQYWSLLSRIFLCFGGLLLLTLALLSILHRSQTDNLLTIVGCLGYFCFAIGLFNTIILLSLDRLRDILSKLVIAMLINFISGYLISSLFGLYLSAIGLVVGGIFFAITSTQQTLTAIDRADYCYFYSGY
jgi:hypothetical protein